MNWYFNRYLTASCVPVIYWFVKETASRTDGLNGVVCGKCSTAGGECGGDVGLWGVIIMFHTGHLSDPQRHLSLVTIENVTSDKAGVRIGCSVWSKEPFNKNDSVYLIIIIFNMYLVISRWLSLSKIFSFETKTILFGVIYQSLISVHRWSFQLIKQFHKPLYSILLGTMQTWSKAFEIFLMSPNLTNTRNCWLRSSRRNRIWRALREEVISVVW